MSRLSSERAQTALHLLILINVIVYAYRDSLRPSSIGLNRAYRLHDGDLRSMLVSIFYHVDPTHLFMNMVALHRYGTEVFVHSSSRRWRSVQVIALSYVICGVGAFAGIELLNQYHEHQWEQKLRSARHANRCSHWLCDSLNGAFGDDVSSYFTNAWSDMTTSFANADLKLSLWVNSLLYRVGASGVVYGWIGMRLVTSWMSPCHSRLHPLDYFFILAPLLYDLNETPLSLERMRWSVMLQGDGIDHTAHLMGALSGMMWALVLIIWEKIASFHWWWSSPGGGRRLGARWEEEEQLQQQREQRRQNSRLLNPDQNNQRIRRERRWL